MTMDHDFTFDWTNERNSMWFHGYAHTLTISYAIAADPQRMWGNPTLRGTRVPLFRVVELYDAGYSPEEIGNDIYPHLGPMRVVAALKETGYDFVDTLDNRTLVTY